MTWRSNAISNKWCNKLIPLLLACFLLSHAYTANADEAPRWFRYGYPTADAKEAVQILKNAAADGLNPNDYSAPALDRALNEANLLPRSAAKQAAISKKLTLAVEQFISDLHYGRVNPREVRASYAIRTKHLVLETYIKNMVANHALKNVVQLAAPKLPQYHSLKKALATYRKLAQEPTFQQRISIAPARKIMPGDTFSGSADLVQRLIALGDLPPDTGIPARYEGALVEGIRAFQNRHGLEVDGVLGKNTVEQLNVPIAARIRQIELSLERIRWTPFLLSKRMIVINLPEFILRAYEVNGSKINVKATMNVIVGKSVDTRTPIFYEDMRYIEFSPYWNIPPSIAKKETVPMLRRSPASFDRQNLEFVGAGGEVIPSLSNSNLDAVMSGKMRIRQRPGPGNALGDIKFIFPNSQNIFLHHTPAIKLFERNRRDFSHGCIRVEKPVELAKFVLQGQPEWTEESIQESMQKRQSHTIRLEQPVPVVITYITAIVKRDGGIYFFHDIYGQDKLLDAALRRKR